ncbi:MAG: PD-(D/E)XK nuclease family protein [Proteobacteria bacterium]|nr:PD-(D/E)XK nuclease family protein [Pseudomonadota bacterium]
MNTPFILIDWRSDCIGTLIDLLWERTGGDLRDALIIFPHQRPRRHLMERLGHDPRFPKPLFLPRMVSVNEWLPALRRNIDPRPLATAGPLDRAGLLYDVVEALRRDGRGLLATLPLERERFFPWGRLLAELMEELARHGITPANLTHLTGEVQAMAAALLEQLGDIGAAYEAALDQRDWTTPGLDARAVMAQATQAAAQEQGRRVFIVGFYALNGAEEAVFKALWRQGAQIVLHTDPILAERPTDAHWACAEHDRWLRLWDARAQRFGPDLGSTRPNLRFFEGFDLHSQLSRLAEELATTQRSDTAVVIPDTSCLMPVLHHLPEKDVNISMGYPLSRSSLFRLIETVLRLQETAPEPGRYYWREVIALIRHPYIKMLEPQPGVPVRGMLRELERFVRRGGKYLDPRDWEPDWESLPDGALTPGVAPQEALTAVRGVLAGCLDAFEAATTLADLGQALLTLARTLVPEHGVENWHRFPIDAECLFRLSSSVAPAIMDSSISHDAYGRPVLYSILRQLLQAERVPFEAEPLTGLQVMGMLESRLLRFSRVMILDATEDKLPGTPAYDPLLPDPLRGLLGLPDGRQRSLVAAYNFHRLIAGADEALIFYQSGADGAGPGAGKAVRSRFVEQLLWDEEKRRGQVVLPDGGLLTSITLPVAGIPKTRHGVDKTNAIQAKLEQVLHTKPLSATFLDSYLHCPARFFHERLTPLREPDEVSEAGDPAGLGQLVHTVLNEFFHPYLGQRLDISALDPRALQDLFCERLEAEEFFRQMSYDMRRGLVASGRQRLARFMAESGDTTILALEKRHQTRLDVDGTPLTVHGFFDRVDLRPEGRVILDYKTGAVLSPSQSLWADSEFWAQILAWGPGDDDPLARLAKRLNSLQLPLYSWLYLQDEGLTPHNAAWVELRDVGQERPLFGPKVDDETREIAVRDYAPGMVRFVVRHMLTSPRFEATPGPRCAYCPYAFGCEDTTP